MPVQQPGAFHLMSHDYNLGNRPGLSLLNLEALVKSSTRTVLGPPRGGRGFHAYPETPRFLIDPKLGRRVRDLEECHEYWLISARLKTVFESVDPSAFAFLACETVLPDGQPGPEHWLCDVLPWLDAVDEPNSIIRVLEPEDGRRRYQFLSNTSLAFRPDIVGHHHIFRLLYRWTAIFCDDTMKKALKSARIDGIHYRNAAHLG